MVPDLAAQNLHFPLPPHAYGNKAAVVATPLPSCLPLLLVLLPPTLPLSQSMLLLMLLLALLPWLAVARLRLLEWRLRQQLCSRPFAPTATVAAVTEDVTDMPSPLSCRCYLLRALFVYSSQILHP